MSSWDVSELSGESGDLLDSTGGGIPEGMTVTVNKEGDLILVPDMSKDENKPIVLQNWTENATGHMWAIGQCHKRMPSGLYCTDRIDGIGPVFKKMSNDIDSLVALPDSESEILLEEVVEFQGLKPKFKELGLLYKRGILLWGPPGSGKTSTIQQLIKMFTRADSSDGIALMIDHPHTAKICLQMLRRLEPDRMVLAIMEDIDGLQEEYGETGYLQLMDGEAQIENICYVATTNYPEKLDKRFTDRPSRFDTIRYIGMPSFDARLAYISARLPKESQAFREDYAEKTDGFSIAYIREFIVLTHAFGYTLEEAKQRLKEMHNSQPESTRTPDSGGGTGFGFTGGVSSKPRNRLRRAIKELETNESSPDFEYS